MIAALTFFGNANAQDLESLVMPGQVISGHQELETECSSCHKRFNKKGQDALCKDCHEDIASDLQSQRGFHGLSVDVGDVTCASCHTDHKGRDADIVTLDETTFNHDFTNFELLGAHREAECGDCHATDEKRRGTSGLCIDCHRDDDVHKTTLGEECGSCHESTEWVDATFDHDTTGYALLGKHLDAACLDCHEDETYQNAPATCFGCHSEDDAHDGRSGNECESCHNPSDWNDSSFSHERDTEFLLEGKHAQLACNNCHSDDPFQDEMKTTCIACHLDDDEHDGHNGVECTDCHSNDDWGQTRFDHDRDTEYQLRGSHREVVCNDCHIEPIFEVALLTTCDTCHLDDQPHRGTLGTQCESCHSEVNWQDPVFFDHDLAAFPLLGKHDDNECEDCHETKAFTDVETTCSACHIEDDPHKGNFSESCEDCHNPVAWDIWTFDHDQQTEFPLTGAHAVVACADCHRSPLNKMLSAGATCRSCHRTDDVHDGEFGFDCGRCHSADSFRQVRSLQ